MLPKREVEGKTSFGRVYNIQSSSFIRSITEKYLQAKKFASLSKQHYLI